MKLAGPSADSSASTTGLRPASLIRAGRHELVSSLPGFEAFTGEPFAHGATHWELHAQLPVIASTIA